MTPLEMAIGGVGYEAPAFVIFVDFPLFRSQEYSSLQKSLSVAICYGTECSIQYGLVCHFAMGITAPLTIYAAASIDVIA